MIFDFKEDKATEAQLRYLELLFAEIQEMGGSLGVDDTDLDKLTRAQASELIDDWKIILGWA